MYSSTEEKTKEDEEGEESTGQLTVHSLLRAGDGKQTYVWSPRWCDTGTRPAFLHSPSPSTWWNLQEGDRASATDEVVLLPSCRRPSVCVCVCVMENNTHTHTQTGGTGPVEASVFQIFIVHPGLEWSCFTPEAIQQEAAYLTLCLQPPTKSDTVLNFHRVWQERKTQSVLRGWSQHLVGVLEGGGGLTNPR